MMDTAELRRAKLRRLMELPMCRKSSTDIWYTDPMRASPNTERPLPQRPKWRKLIADPRWTKSSKDIELPIRPKLRKLSADPKETNESKLMELLRRPKLR